MVSRTQYDFNIYGMGMQNTQYHA